MNTKHPETSDLNEYLQQPQAEEFSALRLHLAGCADCRTQIDTLESLHSHYPSLQSETIDSAQQQEVEDFIDGSANDYANLQKIKTNPAALKAALHYASHSAAMNEEIKPDIQQQKISIVDSLKFLLTHIFEYRSPMWLTASVSAVLVLALSVFVFPEMNSADKSLQIVQYQDNPQIQFRPEQALPGIGFFSKTEEESHSYDGLNVVYARPDKIRLSWAPVDRAKLYKLRLQMIAQGKKNTLAEISTELNQAEIKLNATDINHRYEWRLSGITHDGKTFMTSGGFVINDPSIEENIR